MTIVGLPTINCPRCKLMASPGKIRFNQGSPSQCSRAPGCPEVQHETPTGGDL